MDLRVIEAVAGEPVHFVDDHVVDGMFLDVAEHLLQFWPRVGELGGLAPLDELLDDHSVDRCRLATIGFQLCGQ
nr:hypothetical protein [Mycolicibacterium agri]